MGNTPPVDYGQYWGAGVAVDPELYQIVASGSPDVGFSDRVRSAFVLLEQRIRAKANLTEHYFSKDLVNEAFAPNKGVLQPVSPVQAECAGLHHLLYGAFLFYRNPIAHRPVYHDKQSAWQVFHLINHLLNLVEQAAQAAFDIHEFVGFHEGEILRRRDFRLDIDADGDLDIVALLELGPQIEDDKPQGHLLPVVLHKEATGYRRIPADGVIGSSIHGPLSVRLGQVTNTNRADLVVYWGAGQTTTRCFFLRWNNDRYELVKRDIGALTEPYIPPNEDYFTLHPRQETQLADIDGDGLVEVIQQLSFAVEDLPQTEYKQPTLPENGWWRICRVWRWDAQQQRLAMVDEKMTAGTGYAPSLFKVRAAW